MYVDLLKVVSVMELSMYLDSVCIMIHVLSDFRNPNLIIPQFGACGLTCGINLKSIVNGMMKLDGDTFTPY